MESSTANKEKVGWFSCFRASKHENNDDALSAEPPPASGKHEVHLPTEVQLPTHCTLQLACNFAKHIVNKQVLQDDFVMSAPVTASLVDPTVACTEPGSQIFAMACFVGINTGNMSSCPTLPCYAMSCDAMHPTI